MHYDIDIEGFHAFLELHFEAVGKLDSNLAMNASILMSQSRHVSMRLTLYHPMS